MFMFYIAQAKLSDVVFIISCLTFCHILFAYVTPQQVLRRISCRIISCCSHNECQPALRQIRVRVIFLIRVRVIFLIFMYFRDYKLSWIMPGSLYTYARYWPVLRTEQLTVKLHQQVIVWSFHCDLALKGLCMQTSADHTAIVGPSTMQKLASQIAQAKSITRCNTTASNRIHNWAVLCN